MTCTNCGRAKGDDGNQCRAGRSMSNSDRAELDCERAKSAALESKIAALRSALPAIIEAAIDNPRYDSCAQAVAGGESRPSVLYAPCQERGARVAQLIRAAIGD